MGLDCAMHKIMLIFALEDSFGLHTYRRLWITCSGSVVEKRLNVYIRQVWRTIRLATNGYSSTQVLAAQRVSRTKDMFYDAEKIQGTSRWPRVPCFGEC